MLRQFFVEVMQIRIMKKKLPLQKYNGGQAMITAVLFFLSISLIIVIGISTPIFEQIKIANTLLSSKTTYFLSEAGVEDVTYRLKRGLSVSTTETLTLNGFSANTSITSDSQGKTIIAEGNRHNNIRRIQTKLTTGVGVAFNYGLQVGAGGVSMSGSSGVNGSVYSNGSILGSGSTYITGTAIAASGAVSSSDQSNVSPLPPPNSIIFGNASATQDVAQSFVVSATDVVNKVKFYIKKIGNPSNATVRIVTNQSGSPSTNTISTGSLSASLVTTAFGLVDVTFTNNVQLTTGTTYWLVIDASTNSTNYYTIGANTSYGSGQAKIGRYSSSWGVTTPSGLDIYFDLYTGGVTALIGGETYPGALRIGTGVIGDAWAHTVTGTTVAGNLYCQTGSNNNKSCNTSNPDPVPQNFPISDGNIQGWKDEAEGGGIYSGNYSVGGSSSSSLGPKKITGNLTVSNSGVLTVNGTLWVQGNLIVSGSGKLKLSTSYGSGSGVIVVDGYVSLGGSGVVEGSGQAGSYILVLSTSDCPVSPSCSGNKAIEIDGSAGSVILNAQRGSIEFEGSAKAKEATAYKIEMEGSAVVNYESGLADVNFSSGPSGGYTITDWKEIE